MSLSSYLLARSFQVSDDLALWSTAKTSTTLLIDARLRNRIASGLPPEHPALLHRRVVAIG